MKQYSSLHAIHRVYWRHTLRYSFDLILQTTLFVLLAWLVLVLASGIFLLGAAGINTVFVLFSLGFVYCVIRLLVDWANHGFSIRTFFHKLEEHHPEIANRASMLVYAEQDNQEIQRLGYSAELIAADDSWLHEYMTNQLKHTRSLVSAGVIIGIIMTLVVWTGVCIVEPDFVSNQNQRILSTLWVRGFSQHGFPLSIPETVTVARGDAITLSAAIPDDIEVDEGFIHMVSRAGWRSYSAKVEENQITFRIPSVRQEVSYYFSAGEVLSNLGNVLPLDPPVIQDAQITVVPPEYTGLETQEYSSLRPLRLAEGSVVKIQSKASTSLAHAHFTINDETHAFNIDQDLFGVAFDVTEDKAYSITMTDSDQLTNTTPVYPIQVIRDATPVIDIIRPAMQTTIPDELRQLVQIKLTEDYRIEQVVANHWINDNKENAKALLLWNYSPEAAAEAGSATTFFLSYEWDLAQDNIFPGDEISYQVTAWDNDAIHGQKTGTSAIHVIRYPSLSDILSELEEQEENQLAEMNDLVREQDQIIKEMEETTGNIAEKLEEQAFQEEPEEGFWEEKSQLENLKDRQQELVEKAKKLEQELEQFEEGITESMPVEQQQEQGFTMETLEKMERVRELMKDLLDQDSQRMMETMENTIQKLSEDITPEDIEEMNFSVENFKEQLDRTLSLLENNVMERQLDGLKQMAQELAQRQDHLERESQQILEEEQLIAQQEAALQEQMQQEMQEQNQQSGEQQNNNQQNQDGNQQESQNQDGSQNEQSQNEQNNGEQPQEQNGENSEEASAEEQSEVEQAQEALEKRRQELENRKELLEERQEKLNSDTENMFEKIDSMKEEMMEDNPIIAQQMESLKNMSEQKGLMQQMKSAMKQMQQQNMQQAQQHQQEAKEQLQEMAEQMEQQMGSMNMMAMQLDLNNIVRLIERGLFLSDNLEGLSIGKHEMDSQRAIHRAKAYSDETNRIHTEWNDIAASNPFMSQTVSELLDKSQNQINDAIQSSKGVKWVALHESRQSLIALNDALYTMLEDSQQMQKQMQQQMQQSQAQSMQQQLQQMLQQQQQLGQQMQEMRSRGEQGQPLLEKLQKMAQQQQMIRRKMEEMMQQYKNARQMRNQLQGIYEDMSEVENMLQEGENGEAVEELQKRIETRLLEAGTFQEKDEYGKTRKAESAESGLNGESAEQIPDMTIEQQATKAAQRAEEEEIPDSYKEAIKNYYIKLNQSLQN